MKPPCFGDLRQRENFLGKCIACEYQRECVKPQKDMGVGRAHRPK